jgi:hypothetical protein
MAVALIPLDSGQASAIDELAGPSPLFINMLAVGPPGNPRPVRTRPGIRAWAPFYGSFDSKPVVAMATLDGHLFYVTDDGTGSGARDVYSLNSLGTLTALSVYPEARIAGTEPVSLAVGRSHVIAAGGGPPQKISPGISARLGGNPPHASDAAFIAQFLVLVRSGNDGIFFFSEPGEGGIETWDLGLNFTEAEARPDRLVGCRETSRELVMFGATTTQVFVPDPDPDVVWAPASTMETGCVAKGSIVRHDQQFAWIDDRERIILAAGRDLVVLSDRGLAATLKTLTNLTDVWSFRATIGNHDLLTWSFPSDGRAFSFDMISQTWSEWRRWHEDRWQAWAPRSHLWWPERRVHLLGMPDGTIAEMSLEAYSDLTDPLKWEIRTGFTEAETRRQAWETRFPVRRGEATDVTSNVSVAWRDDLGDFCPPIEFPLGQAEQKDPEVVVSPAGMPYKRRQYELKGSGADAYSIGVGKEIYEEVEF